MLVYFESGHGCGIREARDVKSAERAILKEVGTFEGVTLVQKATEENISWVKAMGGYVPSRA